MLFARRPAAPELALTSSVELERSAADACSTYHRWVRALLDEAAFGPTAEILWHRGPVFAAVQVQFRSRAAASVAHRWVLRLAQASDRRLRRVLAAS